MRKVGKKTLGDWIFDIITYTVLSILGASMLYPFLNTIALSLSTPFGAVNLGLRIWPLEFSTNAYKQVLSNGHMVSAYGNTIYRTVVSIVLYTLFTFTLGYFFTKDRLPGYKVLNGFFLFTMFFGGGTIPTYILMKQLGWLNTMTVLIVPGLYSVWNAIIIRNYIYGLPGELEEAALIDGASPFTCMIKVILPLCVPIIATVAMWTGVGTWNAWFDGMIYITDNSKQVLQVFLRRITMMEQIKAMFPSANLGGSAGFTETTLKSATIMLTIGPIVLIYPFCQKYYVKGISAGAVKG